MERYRSKPILPGITLLYGFPEECCIYALEGERAVAVIDTFPAGIVSVYLFSFCVRVPPVAE